MLGGRARLNIEMIIDSPRELASSLNHQLRLGLTPRPWKLHEPADTLWWLVPSTDWPAYRHGKLVFSLAKDSPRKPLLGLDDELIAVDGIFAGLNIEKGYGRVAIAVDPALRRKTAQIVDEGWAWWRVVDGKDGTTRFGKMLAALSASNRAYLYVVSSYVHDRESDVHPERDAVVFSCDSASLRAVLNNNFPVDVLRGIEKATNFATLAARLRTIDDYHWVDLYVGAHVAKGEVDLNDLDRRLLSHFREWVVEA